jgi:hypothetical protein
MTANFYAPLSLALFDQEVVVLPLALWIVE